MKAGSAGRLRGLAAATLAMAAGVVAGTGSWGCAPGGIAADRFLESGDYGEALDGYRAAHRERPDDPVVLRNLGLAHYELSRPDSAAVYLDAALALRPDDPIATYFLARAEDAAGDRDAALNAYLRYLQLGGRRTKLVRTRVRELSMAKAMAEVTAAIAREREIDPEDVPENSIAVTDFTNVAERPDLDPLTAGLAAVLVTDLSKVEALRVLERERIRVLLGELDLAGRRSQSGASAGGDWHPLETMHGIQERLAIILRPDSGEAYYQGPTDGSQTEAYRNAVRDFQRDRGLTVDGIPGPQTRGAIRTELEATGVAPEVPVVPAVEILTAQNAPRMGRILGARRFVQGSFAPVGEEDIQLDAALVESFTGSPANIGDPVVGPLPNVLRLEKTLVYQILHSMGIDPPPDERRRLDRLATDRYEAFLAFGRGLTLQERGDTQAALAAFRVALDLDPGFELAREREEMLSLDADDASDADRAELLRAISGAPATADRIVRTGTWVGLGPGPIIDRDGQLDPAVQPADKVVTDAEIVIEGDLPGGRTP